MAYTHEYIEQSKHRDPTETRTKFILQTLTRVSRLTSRDISSRAKEHAKVNGYAATTYARDLDGLVYRSLIIKDGSYYMISENGKRWLAIRENNNV